MSRVELLYSSWRLGWRRCGVANMVWPTWCGRRGRTSGGLRQQPLARSDVGGGQNFGSRWRQQ
eukprot:4487745-Prymnesium_polylepis.1